jgi:hypothetical protein
MGQKPAASGKEKAIAVGHTGQVSSEFARNRRDAITAGLAFVTPPFQAQPCRPVSAFVRTNAASL